MHFYYDPRTFSAVDRDSGLIVRMTSSPTDDSWVRYILIDHTSLIKTFAGLGRFEFSARQVVESNYVEADGSRLILTGILKGCEILLKSVEMGFSEYMKERNLNLEDIKSILSAAFLVELDNESPNSNFEINFI